MAAMAAAQGSIGRIEGQRQMLMMGSTKQQ